MAINSMRKILEHLQRSAFPSDGTGLSDGQLLERYLHHREDAAFAALVRRHGPMVLSVCHRILGNDHDAEDAFQASFLVLVRKAASVRPRERVANFLYGVAHTTALRARGLIAKRRTREKQVMQMPEPEARPQEVWDDLRPLLDRELSRLPEKYRVPIVLCDLEDRPIKEAARHLGWRQGTLAGRLARARVMLAKRLARHGLTVSGGALALLLSQQARSTLLPSRLIGGTMEAARLFAAGQAASGLIAAPVVALTEGVLKTMFLTKLKIVTAVVMVTAALALTAAGGLYEAVAGDEPEPKTPEAARPAPANAPEVKTFAKTKSLPADSVREPLPEASDTDELPTTPMPQQALVRIQKEQLVVRTLSVTYEPITVMHRGIPITSYQQVEIWKTRRYSSNEMVRVYDMKGKRIDLKQLPKLLKKESVALVSSDERVATPLNLRLFKEGTLLFILGAASPTPTSGVPTPPPGVPIQPPPVVVDAPPGSPVPPHAPAPASPVPASPFRLAPREPAPASSPAESPRPPIRRTAPQP